MDLFLIQLDNTKVYMDIPRNIRWGVSIFENLYAVSCLVEYLYGSVSAIEIKIFWECKKLQTAVFVGKIG
jgi:hypothetical protein